MHSAVLISAEGDTTLRTAQLLPLSWVHCLKGCSVILLLLPCADVRAAHGCGL